MCGTKELSHWSWSDTDHIEAERVILGAHGSQPHILAYMGVSTFFFWGALLWLSLSEEPWYLGSIHTVHEFFSGLWMLAFLELLHKVFAAPCLNQTSKNKQQNIKSGLGCVTLLMIEILHDVIYQNCGKYGSIVCIGPCKVSIINRRDAVKQACGALIVRRLHDSLSRND